jgi:hypothetical protein
VKTVKTFSTELEANVARIALETAGVPSVVVGIGVAMEGGAAGVTAASAGSLRRSRLESARSPAGMIRVIDPAVETLPPFSRWD